MRRRKTVCGPPVVLSLPPAQNRTKIAATNRHIQYVYSHETGVVKGAKKDTKNDLQKDFKKDPKEGPNKNPRSQRRLHQVQGECPHGHHGRYTYIQMTKVTGTHRLLDFVVILPSFFSSPVML